MVNEWRPIEAYDDFRIVIFFDGKHVWPGHRHNSRHGTPNEFIWFTGATCEPTHWMPLPKPPTAQDGTPDLYEALRQIDIIAAEMGHPDTLGFHEARDRILEITMAALAKARGEDH